MATVTIAIGKVRDALGLTQDDLDLAESIIADAGQLNYETLCGKHDIAERDVRRRWDVFKRFAAAIEYPFAEALHAARTEAAMYSNDKDDLLRQMARLESALNISNKRREDSEDYVGNVVRELVQVLGPLEATPFAFQPKQLPDADEEYAVAEWSDWQEGSCWRSQDVAGLDACNKDIIAARIAKLTEKIIHLVQLQRQAVNINDLIINCLGDMIEGDVIFDSQGVFTDQHGLAQLASVVNHMECALRTLLQHFREIRMYCVWGNHGRMGPKKNSQHPQNNWDHMLYLFLAERFRDEPRLRIFISTAPWMAYNLPKAPAWNHLLLHGDGIPQNLGIPWYGINRETAKVTDIMDAPMHFVHLGHFHQAAQLDKPYGAKIINGCLTGPSPFAVKLMLAGLPKQLLFGLHPEVGQTWQYQIYLGTRPNTAPDGNGIMTSYTQGLEVA